MNVRRSVGVFLVGLFILWGDPVYSLTCGPASFVESGGKKESVIHARVLIESHSEDKTLNIEVLSVLDGEKVDRTIEIDRSKWEIGESFPAGSEWLFRIRPTIRDPKRYWFSLCSDRLKVDKGMVKGWITGAAEVKDQTMTIEGVGRSLANQSLKPTAPRQP